MADAATNGTVAVELSKDDLLKYVELDLWGRFQERLWKVVGIILTGITVIGFLGVPYYIRNEVRATLQTQATEFKNNTNEIRAYAKLLAIATAQYESERIRFDAQVYRLIDAVKHTRAELRQKKPEFIINDPEEILARLVSRPDFSKVVTGSLMSKTELFSVPGEFKDKKLLPPTAFVVENKGLSGSGGYSEMHPVRDGSYAGALQDLRFRIVALEARRKTLDALQEKLVTLGGVTDIEKQVESVREKSIETTYYSDVFTKEMMQVANSFLSSADKKAFERAQSLYLPQEQATYHVPVSAVVDKPGAPKELGW